jgi:septal ring factor EnvC (AmiA/AmiB activator)
VEFGQGKVIIGRGNVVTHKKLSVAVVIAATFIFTPFVSAAQSTADLQGELNAANQQVQGLQAQVDSHSEEAATLADQIAGMDRAIAEVLSQVADTQAKTVAANAELAAIQKEMAGKQAVLNSYIQEEYFNPDPSTVELIASADSLSQVIDRQEYIAAGRDKINEALAGVVETKRAVEAKKANLDTLTQQLGQQQAGIQAQRAAKQTLLDQTKGDEAVYQAQLQEAQANQDKINRSLEWLAGSGNLVSKGHVEKGQIIGYVGLTGNTFGAHLHFETRVGGQTTNPMPYLTSGKLAYPVEGFNLAQGYGASACGYCGYSFHTGVDLAVGYGTPIRAAAAGEIIVNAFTGDGYGHKIIIDHGNGLWTLYGHMQQ